jgi:signal transduction histidine kinase
MARDLMAELRPPALDDYGLVAALRSFAEAQAEGSASRLRFMGPICPDARARSWKRRCFALPRRRY